MAKVFFPKYVGGVESKPNRAFDEELLVLSGIQWDILTGPPLSRAHDFIETEALSQEELERAISLYDHTVARANFEGRHPTSPSQEDLIARVKALEDYNAAR